jgi:hypothetical protein
MSDRCRLFALALALALPTSGFAVSRAPPAYRFEPGDRLVYELRSQSSLLTTGEVAERCFNQVEIWCLGSDGGEMLLLLDSIRLVDDRPEPMRGIILRIDARGQPEMTPATQAQTPEMQAAFDVLPVQASALDDRGLWTTPTDLFGCRRNCCGRADDQQPGTTRVEYQVAFPPGDGEVLGHSQCGKYWFDAAKGYVTRFESAQITKLAGRRTESTGILRLRRRKPAGWAERRAAEAEQYLIALRRETGLLAQIQDHPETVEQALESLDRLWAGYSAQFAGQDSPFHTLVQANRQRCSAGADRLRRIATYARSWLGRTAVPWTLLDARGRNVSSEAVRSGPCVEFLWRTDVPHSFDMLAALQSDRAELAGPEVPVICLNLDQDSTVGRQSIAVLPAGLTHLLAGPIEAVEQPVDLPILRVLDRDGRIVRVWVGWQPSCAEALAEARRRWQ